MAQIINRSPTNADQVHPGYAASASDSRSNSRSTQAARELWTVAVRTAGFPQPNELFFRIMSRPTVAAFIAWLGLSLGVAVSIWGADIRDATRRFGSAVIDVTAQPVDWPASLFWLALMLWARLLYLRLITDEENKARRAAELARTVSELKGAIFRAPIANVYGRAKKYFDETVETLGILQRELDAEAGAADARSELLQAQIQVILHAVVRLVKAFNVLGDESIRYGANVMLLEESRASETPPLPTALVSRVKFFDLNRFAEEKLLGMLYIPTALAYPPVDDDPCPPIHEMVLPVPRKADQDGVLFALPGGPWAFLTGEMSVHEDTRSISREWQHLDEQARRQLNHRFSERGPGAHVRSFASFRIGDKNQAVGVLNIDSDQPNILGADRLYYLTFHTLVGPFIQMLERPVREYEQRTRNSLFGVREARAR